MKTFEQFKIELQLACDKTIADGKIIGKDCCPLGSISTNAFIMNRFPVSRLAYVWWDIKREFAWAFIVGYDSSQQECHIFGDCKQYAELGIEYRNKYPRNFE